MGGSGVQAPPLLCREFEASTGYVKEQKISLDDCFRNEVCRVSFMQGTSSSAIHCTFSPAAQSCCAEPQLLRLGPRPIYSLEAAVFASGTPSKEVTQTSHFNTVCSKHQTNAKQL